MSKPAWKVQQEERERVIKEREEKERQEKEAKLKGLVTSTPVETEQEIVVPELGLVDHSDALSLEEARITRRANAAQPQGKQPSAAEIAEQERKRKQEEEEAKRSEALLAKAEQRMKEYELKKAQSKNLPQVETLVIEEDTEISMPDDPEEIKKKVAAARLARILNK